MPGGLLKYCKLTPWTSFPSSVLARSSNRLPNNIFENWGSCANRRWICLSEFGLSISSKKTSSRGKCWTASRINRWTKSRSACSSSFPRNPGILMNPFRWNSSVKVGFNWLTQVWLTRFQIRMLNPYHKSYRWERSATSRLTLFCTFAVLLLSRLTGLRKARQRWLN